MLVTCWGHLLGAVVRVRVSRRLSGVPIREVATRASENEGQAHRHLWRARETPVGQLLAVAVLDEVR
jgi:hypothetical protein